MEFLQMIRGVYAEIEDEFDNDFVQEEGIYSTAGRTKRNEVESRLVQLHLTIGQLEDYVEATMKSNDSSHVEVEEDFVQNRKLFPTPSVNENGWNAAYSDSKGHLFRHRGSIVSIAGNCDVEAELQDFNKAYTDLMDQYRRLKQMKISLQRDDDITVTLAELKKVYRQIPEHRKPPLPAELENQYNPVRGSFIDTNSEQEEKKQNGLNGYASQQEFSTSAEASTVITDSDLSSGSKPDSVKHYLTSERQSKEQSSASEGSGSSQNSLQLNGMPPISHAKDTVISRNRDNSVPSERPRHGTRRLPRNAATSKSQSASIQDELGNGYHKSSGSKRSTHHKPPLPSNLQINARTRVSGLQTKTEQKMLRTSARTPPGQSYSSDMESDRTDDTVEEIFKQKRKTGRDQLDNTDGFSHSKTKDEHRQTASVGSSGRELDGTASVTEDELSILAAKRSDKREERAESAHLQKFTETQQRQMPQPIPLHPTTTGNPPVTVYVSSLQRLHNPYLQSIQQPSLQQLQFRQPDMHQVYVPTGTAPTGTVPAGTVPAGTFTGGTLPAGIFPAHSVTGNQGETYFNRNGYLLQPHEPTHILENGYGQSAYVAHSGVNYDTYPTEYLKTDRAPHHRITRDGQRIGREDKYHRRHQGDRYQKSPHRSRTSRKRYGSKSLDDPLPSAYFEPTAREAYPYLFTDSNGLSMQRPAFIPSEADAFPTQYTDPYSYVTTSNPYSNGVGNGVGVGSGVGVGTGVGVGSGLPTIYESLGITSRGIQNVPSMSTTGVQYMMDNGTRGIRNHTGLGDLVGQSTADQPVVITGASCPICGRVDYHTHTDSNLQEYYNRLGYVPASSSTQAGVVPGMPLRGQTLVQLPNGQTGLAFVGSPSNTVGQPYKNNTAFPSTLAAGSVQAITVPTQTLPNVTSSLSRIRYYVREYEGRGNEDVGNDIRYEAQAKQADHNKRSSKHHLSTDDDDDEVDWALLRAVSTAKSLKKRSEEMMTSIHDELLLSLRDSTILQSF